ncbi:MAG: hypothetical protein KDA27_16445 [Candidatus Eisenbacteria bacterium]|uniref:Uncharacterized protein n=1 Tax=Eiseniibacteriota bacterium TaxID=2212470 RepID=A0A956NHB5_UNCEI|nr:hypothetical protein [Candidatus Eisenbacteria bacterium]
MSPAPALTLQDEPVIWWDDDDASIGEPSEREPNIIWDSIEDTVLLPADRLFDPTRLVRRVGTAFGGDHVQEADDINALGEVVNSTWFTNRIGLFPMTAEEAARGAGSGTGPDRSGPWTIVSAKTQGVTPGFNIKDAKGDTYLIKFDPKGYLGMTTCAGVVCGKILHDAGYNVPEDVTVRFRRSDLVLGDGVKIKLADGSRRPMTDEDIDEILNAVDRLPNGEWFAISSKFLSGRPIGPFNYHGKRPDDPNDRIPHEDRRSLRGFYLFASWLNHFDTKQHNSLDMYVEEDGRQFVKHYLIDFASTLGSGAKGPQPRHGYEYTVDFPALGGRLFSLGLHESVWRTRTRSENVTEVGYFDVRTYDPIEFKPLQPNSAFANRTGEDGYWAAKIITAFTDEQIDAIVESAGYLEPEATQLVAETLKGRRDAIGRSLFTEVPALDFFALGWSWSGPEPESAAHGSTEQHGRTGRTLNASSASGQQKGDALGGPVQVIRFRDLAAERNIFPHNVPAYRMRVARVDENGESAGWTDWTTSSGTELRIDEPILSTLGDPDEERPFLAMEAQVRRHKGWSESVFAYFSPRSGRTIRIER